LTGKVSEYPVDLGAVQGWLMKARAASEALLEHAGKAAHPGLVTTRLVDGLHEAAFGNFMLCWPEDRGGDRVIHHLPDAGFFLTLLEKAFAPVLAGRSELRELIYDGSRIEVAFTNDVLQAQLRGDWEPYSMIRHHALMLFHGLLWLDEPVRSRWVELYEALAEHVVARDGGPPSILRLAEAEATAFADFTRLAGRTHDPADAAALLDDEQELAVVLEYQVLAAMAVLVLWRDYQRQPEERRISWQHNEIAEGYGRQDYLERRWTELLQPTGGKR
jgi:hypothetical protein